MGGAVAVWSMVGVSPVAPAPTVAGVLAVGVEASGGGGGWLVMFVEGLMVCKQRLEGGVPLAVTGVGGAGCVGGERR